jgi:isoquinoline 1-oxidoreductase beta subunit
VHRVSCAVDCGLAVNPDQVVAQMQSGIIYGLSAALTGEITIRDGAPVQGNFDTYTVLRMTESPAIDVRIVPSDGPIGGVGEPGTPPIAPAVCGAVFAATGQRIRRLPLSASLA